MKSTSCILLFAALTLVSCGGEKEGAGASSAPGAKSCLAAYETKLGDMLKRDRLDALFGTKDADAKPNLTDAASLKSYAWSWPSDRTRKVKVGPTEMEFPHDNQVSVSQFKALAKAEFGPKDGKAYVERNHRSISPEEMAAAQERMKEQLRLRVEKGELTQEQANMAGGLGGDLMGGERVVETIEGVGDAARWTARDKTLAVGHGDVFFALYVDVSEDTAVNRDKAIALAKEILKECD